MRLLPAPFAVLALALCSATPGCSSEKKTSPAEGRGGAQLYATYCALCHGAKGDGSSMNLGPSYKGIAKYWDVERLLEYVDDPQAFAATDERLGQREMAALPGDVTPEERRRLVEHALSLMD